MRKLLYFLPSALILLIYGFILLAVAGTFDAALDMVQSVVVLYILLPVCGSVLLSKGKWWGGLVGAAMGLLLVWNNLQYSGHQHIDVDIPIGIFIMIYYLTCGLVERKHIMDKRDAQ